MKSKLIPSSAISLILLIMMYDGVNCDSQGSYFLKAAKNVPRIGRSNPTKTTNTNTNIDEMGKFFLKASKSVPRIGRRNQILEYKEMPYPYVYDDLESDPMIQKRAHYPIWSELPERFEYEPEIFSSPEYLMKLQQEMGDDPSVYEWDKVRMKRQVPVLENAKKSEFRRA